MSQVLCENRYNMMYARANIAPVLRVQHDPPPQLMELKYQLNSHGQEGYRLLVVHMSSLELELFL
jgi:hypothetical protein